MTSVTSWTAPDDAKAELVRLWERGRILAADLRQEAMFPLRLRLKRPDSRAMSDHFDEVRAWIRSIEAGARAVTGTGYDIEWAEVEHRQLGRNRIPGRLIVPTRDDALRWIGKLRQAERFHLLATATLARFPGLRSWIEKRPLRMLELSEEWERILDVLAWFTDHPRAGVFLRQVDVRGVDTKFIETKKGLFIELLGQILPEQDIGAGSGRQFELRYGLLSKPPLVRFRLLDPQVRVSGMSDIATPLSQFAQLDLSARRIFITENELNGLTFPEVPESIVVFGLGYGVECLSEVPWLADKEIHYWGDIDTHGFAILDRLRASFPEGRSFLMDREILLEHRHAWVIEEAPHTGRLERLTPAEAALVDELKANSLGDRVRLEQERIGFGWVQRALERIRCA